MNPPLLSAEDTARYFLATVDEESGDNLTNLKLQKLLYYAQGLYLAMHGGEPLFSDPIYAWEHGPVVPQVYLAYKGYGSDPIKRPDDFDSQHYAPEARELLDAVSKVYGQFSAWKPRDLRHEEAPCATLREMSRFPAGHCRSSSRPSSKRVDRAGLGIRNQLGRRTRSVIKDGERS